MRNSYLRVTAGTVTTVVSLLVCLVLFSSADHPASPPGADPWVTFAELSEWSWPTTDPPVVLRTFDPPLRPWLPGHRGVDLSATPGDEIRAAHGGVVVFAGAVAGTAAVSIEHPGELRTTHEPVLPTVVAGQTVVRGQVIGYLLPAHPTCPAPGCLHWGLRSEMAYLNPLSLLGLGRVRLYPERSP